MFRIIVALMALILTQGAQAASQEHHITAGGLDRSYLLYAPASLTGQLAAVPLVIVLHGGFGTGAQAEHSYGWDAQADAHGFIVAYPNGINRSWNAGGICCGKASKNDVDDLKFITRTINDVSRIYRIDPKRIYLTGISNGAAMSYRYACEGAHAIAAVGAVSGSMSTTCQHAQVTSVMEIHGMQDNNIPFDGGFGSKGVSKVSWVPVEETLGNFRKADHCPAPSVEKNGVVKTYRSACASQTEVTLITIDDAGHQWPGSKAAHRLAMMVLPLDPPSQELDATKTLWTFFEKHSAQ